MTKSLVARVVKNVRVRHADSETTELAPDYLNEAAFLTLHAVLITAHI